MAKKRTRRPTPETQATVVERHCCECGWSYDWHNRAVDGHMTLGRCPYHTDGKFCVIAGQKACEHWKPADKDGGNRGIAAREAEGPAAELRTMVA